MRMIIAIFGIAAVSLAAASACIAAGVLPPDAARGLDVLRRRLRLTHHRHKSKAIDVHTHRDHVRCQHDIR